MRYEPDIWLKGPLAGVPAALQPAAFALLQTVEDIKEAMAGVAEEDVWTMHAQRHAGQIVTTAKVLRSGLVPRS